MPTYGPWNTKDVLEDKLKELDWRKQVPSPKPPQAQPPTPLAAPSPTPQPFGAQPQPYRPITPATVPPRDTKSFEAALKPQPNRLAWPAAVEAEFTRSPGAFASNYPALSRRKGKVGWPTGSTPQNPKPHPLSVKEAERAFALEDQSRGGIGEQISRQVPVVGTPLLLANRPLVTPQMIAKLPGPLQPVGNVAREFTSPSSLAITALTAGAGPAIAAGIKGGTGVVGATRGLASNVVAPVLTKGGFAQRAGAELGVGMAGGLTAQEVAKRLPENLPGPAKAALTLGAGLAGGVGAIKAGQAVPGVARGVQQYGRTALETTGPALGIPKQELRTAGMAAKVPKNPITVRSKPVQAIKPDGSWEAQVTLDVNDFTPQVKQKIEAAGTGEGPFIRQQGDTIEVFFTHNTETAAQGTIDRLKANLKPPKPPAPSVAPAAKPPTEAAPVTSAKTLPPLVEGAKRPLYPSFETAPGGDFVTASFLDKVDKQGIRDMQIWRTKELNEGSGSWKVRVDLPDEYHVFRFTTEEGAKRFESYIAGLTTGDVALPKPSAMPPAPPKVGLTPEQGPVPQGPPPPRPAPDVTVPPVEAPKAARTPEEIAAWQKGLEAPAQPGAPPLKENAAAWRPPVGEAERPAVAGALPKGSSPIEAPPPGYKRGELAVVGPGSSPVDDPLYAALKAAVEGTPPPAGAKPPVVEGATPAQPQKPAGFKYAGDMRPIEDVVKEVVTSDNPFVRALAGYTGINPSVLQNTEAGRALTAYYRQMVASQELTEVAIGASLDTHAQRFTGARNLNLDANGFMKGTGKQWNDVFSRYQDYNLKPELKAYVEDYLRVVDEVEALRIANGLKPMPKRSAEGWFYVPRQVKTIRGVELRKPSSPKLQRLHEEATAGYARGVRYETDPRAVLELHVRNAYREIAEKQLSDLLEPLSIKPSQLVPEPVRIRMEQAIKNRMAAERAARKLIQGEAKEGGRVPMPSTFASKVAVDPQVMAARMQYQVAKNAYTRALEAARKAEVAPGKLFGRTEETIGIGNWRNRFYPREMYDQLVKGTEQFGKLSPETHPWLRGVEILGNHIRFLSSVGDFAAPMVQGLPLLARHPAGWARATARHYQAFLDPTVQARLLRDNLETFQWMARHGVPVGDPEFFAALKEGQGISAGKLLTYAPGGEEVRRVLQQGGKQSFGRFQASYNTFLGYGRAQIVKAMKGTWKGTDDELAAYIRNMTGGLDTRALGVQPSQRAIESVWLAFSPRLLRSTAALVGDAMRPNTVRGRAALRSLATLASGVAALYIASGLAMGRDWEEITEGLNPLNGKKFLSYQVNGDWIGVGGQIRAITQLLASGISALAPGGKPAGVLASPDRYDNPIVNFYMGRGAPAVNIVGGMVEAASGGNIDALPFAQVDGAPDLVKHLGTSALPFVAQGVVEGQQPLTSATGMVGMRTSAPTAGEKITRMAEQAGATVSPSGEVGQKGYSQAAMTPEGRAAIRKSGQDLRKWEDRWKYYDAQLERDSDLERSWTVTNQGAKQPYGGKDWVDDYYKSQAEQAATRAVTSKPFTAKTPEAKALADYYAIADQFFNPRTRTFDSAGYQEALDSYLASLGPEMAEYVEGQLHPYETPEVARYNEGRKQYRAYLGVLGKWIEVNYPEYLEQWETYVAQGKPSTSSVLLRNLSSIEDKLRKQMRIDNPELEDWLLRYGYVTVPISESFSRTGATRPTGTVGQPVRGATGVKGITGTSR